MIDPIRTSFKSLIHKPYAIVPKKFYGIKTKQYQHHEILIC